MISINKTPLDISRRTFLYGTGSAAVGAALCALGCASSSISASNAKDDTDAQAVHTDTSDSELSAQLANVDTIQTQLGSVAVLSVAEDTTFTTEDCSFIEKTSKVVKRSARAHLPYGTLIWANDNKIAACLLPCDTASPLTQIGLLSLTSGNVHTVCEKAVGQAEGFHIFDVRANSQGAVWVEADILDKKWRIYTATVSSNGKQLGQAKLADEGDDSWQTPSLAVCGDYAFWQLTPSANSQSNGSNSMLMRVKFGEDQSNAKCVYETTGSFACAPSPAENGIAIAPRAQLESGSGAYYQLTYINAESGIVESALALPSGMKPNYVAYGPAGFSFSFESIYSYGDGISNLGTYVSSGKDAPVYNIDENDTTSNTENTVEEDKAFGEWFRFPRSPYTSPAWMNDYFIVKSTSVVAGVDLINRKYFSIEPEYTLQDYGEYLASEGPVDKVVTYSNIDYTPLGEEHIYECDVRIWETK